MTMLDKLRRWLRRRERVAIAKDALAQLNNERYLANTGAYVHGLHLEHTGELAAVLRMQKIKCSVCAVGALFLSCVRRHNNFNLDEKSSVFPGGSHERYIAKEDIDERLTPWFTYGELCLLEGLFEANEDGRTANGGDSEGVGLAGELGEHDRLEILLRWLIDNRGREFTAKDQRELVEQHTPSYAY